MRGIGLRRLKRIVIAVCETLIIFILFKKLSPQNSITPHKYYNLFKLPTELSSEDSQVGLPVREKTNNFNK